MKALGSTLILVALLLLLAAIWLPEEWIQLTLTGVLVGLVGAGILGQLDKDAER